MPKQYWRNQEVLGLTELFGKTYYWMKDTDGTHYLAKVDEDGQPDLTMQA